MKKTAAIGLILLLIASCTAEELSQVEEIQVQATEQVAPIESADDHEQPESEQTESVSLHTDTPVPTEVHLSPTPPLEPSGPDCLGSEPNEIGLGIIESFPDTTYEQVMTWFCNGAEFEDILVALQTEELTDFPAGEMLLMLADDWTWEEVWQVIGLIEE